MERREFLVRGAMAATAAASFTAKSYAGIVGANGKVNLGIVGLGRRGIIVTGGFKKDPRTEIVALCDVYGHMTADFVKKVTPGVPANSQYVDYKDLLARKDVDAVLVTTPDHLHVMQACDVLAAGKHIYLEKPTVHRWQDHSLLERAAAAHPNLVIQCGTQQRSGAHYQHAKQEFFEGGKLGGVVLARGVWHNFPWQRRDLPPEPKPADLNWDLFQGPAKHVPYEYVRYSSWRCFPAYGGGVLADIMTHWVDTAQWLMNDDRPLKASALGGIYNLHQERENPDTCSAIVQYAHWNFNFESSVLSLKDDHPSVLFEGTNGSLNITREGYTYLPNDGAPVVFSSKQDLEQAHTKSFLDAITTGSKPSAPLSAALAATVPVQMALESYWSGKTLAPGDLGPSNYPSA